MKLNQTKNKLLNGKSVFGVISTTASPTLAEWIGYSGFDYYILDGEHGPITPANSVDAIRVCELTGMTPLIRVGTKDPKLVLQYLDAGAAGIMMPGLMTADEVQMLVDAVKYPPIGKRGLSLARAAEYMMGNLNQAEYVEFANQQTMVIIQFEHPELIDELEALASISQVDVVMIGPRDLALNMGFPDGPDHPEVQSMIDAAIKKIVRAGKAAGITAGTQQVAQRQISRGANLILTSASHLVKQSSQAFLGHSDGLS